MLISSEDYMKNICENNEEKLFELAKDFLDSTDDYIDFDIVLKQLDKISKLNCKLNNCTEKFSLSFVESELFGMQGRISANIIAFNKTRILMLNELKIDCLKASHEKTIIQFYNEYNKKQDHTYYEKILYKFMNNYINKGVAHLFNRMGSFKLVPYELLDTIFHENAHAFQRKYENLLSKKELPNEIDASMLFTVFFNKIYSGLKMQNINFDYKVENHTFPIEFDARYKSMILMNKLREKYYLKDRMFSKYIIYSNLLPENINIKTTVNQILKDYNRLYNFYSSFNVEYSAINEYIQKNIKTIKQHLIKKYEEMLVIVNSCKMNNKIIICGLPGTGKTTLAKALCENLHLNYNHDWEILTNNTDHLKQITNFITKYNDFVLDLDYRNYDEMLKFKTDNNLKIIYLVFDERLTIDILKKIFKDEKSIEELSLYISLSEKYKTFCNDNKLTLYEINKDREIIIKNIIKNITN